MLTPVHLDRDDAVALARAAGEAAYDVVAIGKYRSDEATRTQAMLVATIADGLHAVVALVPSHGQGHADTIIRSMMEALGDLYHIAGNASYLDRLKLESARNIQGAGQEFIRSRIGDPDCAEIVELAKRRCRDAKAVLDALEGSTARLATTERVLAPGLPTEVLGLYAQLCFDAHNDIDALRRRHLRMDSIVLGHTLDHSSALSALCQALMIVSAALDVAVIIGHIDKKVHGPKIESVYHAAERLLAGFVAANEPGREKLRKSLPPTSAT